jgi:hypothetical protein
MWDTALLIHTHQLQSEKGLHLYHVEQEMAHPCDVIQWHIHELEGAGTVKLMLPSLSSLVSSVQLAKMQRGRVLGFIAQNPKNGANLSK